jgi:type VI secretion system protein ImpK
MKLDHWQIIFNVYRQARALLDQWLPSALPDAAGRTQVQVGREGLNQLQSLLLGAVEQLRSELGAHYRSEEVEDALRPFTYLVDEQVLHRLSETEQAEWPFLQYRLFGEEGGGDLFFELADARLNQPGVSPLILELLHFCLTAGFTGRYLGNTAKLREYKQRLADRIMPPLPASSATDAPAEARPLLYEFPVRYYATAGLCVLGLQGLLWWLSH